jgi:hypothetical protein
VNTKTENTIAKVLSLHVIALTIGGAPAYLANEGTEWDGNWFTRDIGRAKTYKLARNAEKRIAEHKIGWADLDPRVVIKSAIKFP